MVSGDPDNQAGELSNDAGQKSGSLRSWAPGRFSPTHTVGPDKE
jgi:hypothetical protein